MLTKVVNEIKQTFSSFAPTLVVLSWESWQPGVPVGWTHGGEQGHQGHQAGPGTRSVLAIGRWL